MAREFVMNHCNSLNRYLRIHHNCETPQRDLTRKRCVLGHEKQIILIGYGSMTGMINFYRN